MSSFLTLWDTRIGRVIFFMMRNPRFYVVFGMKRIVSWLLTRLAITLRWLTSQCASVLLADAIERIRFVLLPNAIRCWTRRREISAANYFASLYTARMLKNWRLTGMTTFWKRRMIYHFSTTSENGVASLRALGRL